MILKKSHFAARIVTVFCFTSCLNLAGFSQTSKSLALQNAAAQYQERPAVDRELKPKSRPEIYLSTKCWERRTSSSAMSAKRELGLPVVIAQFTGAKRICGRGHPRSQH
jgi:hypothetical protein